MPEVNVDFNPFGFVDRVLDRSQTTDHADNVFKFFYNPVNFFKEKFGGKDETKCQPATKPTAAALASATGN